jgi:hypothetical protein
LVAIADPTSRPHGGMLVSSLKVSHELLASPPTFWPRE